MGSTVNRREFLGAAAAAGAGLLALPGCGAGTGDAPSGTGGNTYGPVDAVLRSALSGYGLSALLCGVWEGGAELHSSAMGDSVPGVPATREMHMRVGGVTLTCLCVAMLRLADRGVLSLEDRLSRWYPELPRSGEVTVRMLANCTSGYPDYVLSARFQDDFYGNPFRAFSPEELIAYALETPPLYTPGTDWNYAHTNFVLLGNVLHKVTGQSVAALLKREIIDPLRLRGTDYPVTTEIRPPVLHAYSLERGVFEDSTYWNPSWTSYSGLMISNLHDLGVMARAVGTGSLLSEKSRQEQAAPTTVGLGRNLPDLYYGLGVILMNTWMVQNPRFGGYNLIFAHLPSRRLSVVVSATRGPTSDPDTAYSTRVFKDLVTVLAPDTPIPEGI